MFVLFGPYSARLGAGSAPEQATYFTCKSLRVLTHLLSKSEVMPQAEIKDYHNV